MKNIEVARKKISQLNEKENKLLLMESRKIQDDISS